MKPKRITKKIINNFACNPKTGVLTWNVNKERIKIGNVAGTIGVDGYRLVGLEGITYYAHRICYCIYHGKQPIVIDHINGDKSDNRLANLRSCSKSQNTMNAKMKSNNTSGHTGVTWCKRSEKWYAQLMSKGRYMGFGLHADIKDAVEARKQAEIKYFGKYRYKIEDR